MRGSAKPPGSLAFEPIDPPKRQISRQPPPATEPALWGWSIGNRGGGTHAHTSWALTTSSPTALWAVAVLIPRSLQRPAHRCRARARHRAFHDKFHFGRTSHAWPSLSYPGGHGPGPDPCRPDGRPGAGAQ